eukprot:gene18697-biopygen17434
MAPLDTRGHVSSSWDSHRRRENPPAQRGRVFLLQAAPFSERRVSLSGWGFACQRRGGRARRRTRDGDAHGIDREWETISTFWGTIGHC